MISYYDVRPYIMIVIYMHMYYVVCYVVISSCIGDVKPKFNLLRVFKLGKNDRGLCYAPFIGFTIVQKLHCL